MRLASRNAAGALGDSDVKKHAPRVSFAPLAGGNGLETGAGAVGRGESKNLGKLYRENGGAAWGGLPPAAWCPV